VTELVKVRAGEDSVLDVVFVHGLDGDARRSWSAKRKGSFWPEWLAQDVAGAAVWSLGYDAASSRWLGHAMPIQDRAINLLAYLENHGIGQRPLCFVTHSMGGLVVKEMLLHASEGRAGYAEFAAATRGVVFLATPHIGSDIVAKAIVKALAIAYRTTVAVDALERNGAHLRQLNDRYRDWVTQPDMRVEHRVFFETQPTRGVHVVDAGSANPGLPGHRPIPVDANHIDICKPNDRSDVVYGQVARFIASLRYAPADSREVHTTAGLGGPRPRPSGQAEAVPDATLPQGQGSDYSVTAHGSASGMASTGDTARNEQHTHLYLPPAPIDSAVQVRSIKGGVHHYGMSEGFVHDLMAPIKNALDLTGRALEQNVHYVSRLESDLEAARGREVELLHRIVELQVANGILVELFRFISSARGPYYVLRWDDEVCGWFAMAIDLGDISGNTLNDELPVETGYVTLFSVHTWYTSRARRGKELTGYETHHDLVGGRLSDVEFSLKFWRGFNFLHSYAANSRFREEFYEGITPDMRRRARRAASISILRIIRSFD
jgi:hypothetical protein